MQDADPIDRLKQAARRGFDAAVGRADPGNAVRAQLARTPLPRPDVGGQTLIVALGKAAPAMLRALLAKIDGPSQAICITHKGNDERVEGVPTFYAGHPVPDEDGAAAAQVVISMLRNARAEDRVVALISGGGSALMPAPPEGVTLADKQRLNQLLLKSGLDINAMNLVRQQISQLKGGGFSCIAAPAPVTALILSDVVGDDLRAIASGPTVGPIGTRAEALALLHKARVADALPESIYHHLSTPEKPSTPVQATNHLIGGNWQSVEAAMQALLDGFTCIADPAPLEGDVNAAATKIYKAAKGAGDGPIALLWGGETTVRVTGSGMGGRNQELALRVAALADADPLGRPWVFLSGGTDGRDGPTDAAGAVVDQQSCARIQAKGTSPSQYLDRNDSNAALRLSGDLLITGATGTNVADIQILLIGA